MPEIPTLFADGVLEATVRHGVARLTLAVQDGNGKPSATGLLVVPLAQLPAMAGSISRLMREVEAKARDVQAAAQAPEPAAPEAPAAFRFGG
ncbi:hypothetical protein EAH89_17685 [Roseomonas nepalensis]|uniref:Uncharacterized protein n=1 Tax=Muricoccus nepalensis TaxID=1854500 RepID=A0A502FUJ8_9PROT|nr:hypothetical protein [Roseomonas nepalensis]TPG53145.1 hypothetical protein EAH89_17685 [Roseomonas nepalensis]